MTANLPERPAYFSYDVGVNLRGAPPFNQLPVPPALEEAELQTLARAGALVIDTRPAAAFAAGHFPGSLNIGVASALFSTWVGFLVPGGQPLVLVADSPANAAKARLELARIGFDGVAGQVLAGTLGETEPLAQLSVCDLRAALPGGEAPLVLDVRTPGEWAAGHIEGARHLPLPRLASALETLPRSGSLAVICGSGYRGSIAASLLRARGFAGCKMWRAAWPPGRTPNVPSCVRPTWSSRP